MTSHQAMATGLIAGAVATVAAAAFVLIRKDNMDERLKSVSVSVAGSTLASRPADEPRRRSRFRRHQVDEAAVVGCASRSEFCSCIDHYMDEKDTVIMIRGTTDGTPNKEDGGDGAGESRTVQVVGANRVRIFEGDVWDIHALLALVAQLPGGVVTAVCMETSNIFGNDILCDTLALIRMLRAVLAPHIKMILIRSRAIALHSRCFHDSRVVLAMPTPRRRELEVASRTHCQVLATIGVKDYRETTIPFVVQPGSSVLEIGCCVGTTTFLLAEAAGNEGSVVGIDCGKLCIQRARRQQERRQQHGRVRFEVADGWDMSTLIQLASSMHAPFDAIYIDVGGLSVRYPTKPHNQSTALMRTLLRVQHHVNTDYIDRCQLVTMHYFLSSLACYVDVGCGIGQGADGEFEALALIRMLCCTFKSSLRYIVIKSKCLLHHASVFTHAGGLINAK
eukprot:COSAG02_NODE_1826_length_10754_cov_4.509714_10_plen_449_part_00